jgi:hypothetical protein
MRQSLRHGVGIAIAAGGRAGARAPGAARAAPAQPPPALRPAPTTTPARSTSHPRQGAWCVVDARSCQGYYATFTLKSGEVAYYDYCGDVRGESARCGGGGGGGGWGCGRSEAESGAAAAGGCCGRNGLWLPDCGSARSGFKLARPCTQHARRPPARAERTDKGCLCQAEWKPDRAGKDSYRNRCANPDSESGARGVWAAGARGRAGGGMCGVWWQPLAGCLALRGAALARVPLAQAPSPPRPRLKLSPAAERKCRVDQATCPRGVKVGAFDTCRPNAPQRRVALPGRPRTFHDCACLKGGWWYLYGGGPASAGPVNKTISGCANPDGDPLGDWCAVDPERCERFAGYVSNPVNPVNAFAFDYCNTERPPALSAKRDGCTGERIGEWHQCGGKSGCRGWGCADEPWGGACCAEGLECRRQDAFYWQCVRPGTRLNTGAGRQVGALPWMGTDLPTLAPEGGAQGGALQGAGAAAAAAAAPGGVLLRPPARQRKAKGRKVYVNLRVDYPFDVLASDAGARARFRNDIVGWLKKAAGPPEFVYSAGEGLARAGQGRWGRRAAGGGANTPLAPALLCSRTEPVPPCRRALAPPPGIDELHNGSVIAASHVIFTQDAPPELVMAAPRALQTNAAGLYHDAGGAAALVCGGGLESGQAQAAKGASGPRWFVAAGVHEGGQVRRQAGSHTPGLPSTLPLRPHAAARRRCCLAHRPLQDVGAAVQNRVQHHQGRPQAHRPPRARGAGAQAGPQGRLRHVRPRPLRGAGHRLRRDGVAHRRRRRLRRRSGAARGPRPRGRQERSNRVHHGADRGRAGWAPGGGRGGRRRRGCHLDGQPEAAADVARRPARAGAAR